MSLPENVIPMPAEQRAELKRLAEAATPGPWKQRPNWLAWAVTTQDTRPLCWDDELRIAECSPRPQDAALPREANAAYIAAVSPDVALATLAYVEALEAEVQRLTDSTVSNEVYTARTDAYVAQIDELRAGLSIIEAEKAGLAEQLRPGSPTERAPTQWAYEQACAALEKHRQRADTAEAQVAKVYELLDKETDQHSTDRDSNCTPEQAQFYQHCEGALAIFRLRLEREVPEPAKGE